ncbi:uncharacterized protein LOC144770827 [Lissotriton helveticus]
MDLGEDPEGQDDATVAAKSLIEALKVFMAALNEPMNRPLGSVQTSCNMVLEQRVCDPSDAEETSETVEPLLGELSVEAEKTPDHLTPGQRADTKIQGDPPEAVQRLVAVLTRVTAADRYLQSQRPAADGDMCKAALLLLMPLASLVWDAQYSVLIFRNSSEDQRHLPGASGDLFRDLAKDLEKVAPFVRSSREFGNREQKGGPTGRDPTPDLHLLGGPEDLQLSEGKPRDPGRTSGYNHGRTACLKSVWKEKKKFLLLAAVLLFVIAALLVVIGVLCMARAGKNVKDVNVLPPCGDDWIWYRNKCFYFSEAEGDWMEAEDSCTALNSTLALIDTQQELNLMLLHKGDYNHWIGLRRDNETQPWMWVNGTKFNNWFTVSDASECAYLSYGKVKSLECHIINKWVCTKVTIY